MPLRVLLGACAAACFLLGALPPARARAPADQTWLVASDIHLNPYNRGADPSLYGSDSNRDLFDAAIAYMKRDVPDPAVVLLPGDFFAHNFVRVTLARGGGRGALRKAALNTMAHIAAAFARVYPHAQFAIALGNNDAPCGDYHSELGDAYAQGLARIWQPLIDRNGAAPAFAQTFARGGYYVASLPGRGLRLIALDTVLFSTEYRGDCGAGPRSFAAAQLAWLKATLRDTPPGTRNVLTMHVPPGYDAFTTQTTHGFLPWRFMKGGDNAALVDAIAAPSDDVAFAITGHEHRFDIRIDGGVPIVVVGSISPVYHNNPSFYALRVDPRGTIDDVETYVYDEWTQAWEPPRDFDAKFGVANLSAASLESLHDRIASDVTLRRLWDSSNVGWPSNPSIAWGMYGRLWRIAWCSQTMLVHGFAQCARIERRVVVGRVAIALFIGGLLTICALAIVAILRWVRRRSAGPAA